MTNTEKILSIEEIEKAYPEAYKWARKFHDLYEETAPMFGYETRKETKEFDPTSPNGRLMAYVCFNLINQALAEENLRIKEKIWQIREDTRNDGQIQHVECYDDILYFLDKPLTDKEIKEIPQLEGTMESLNKLTINKI